LTKNQLLTFVHLIVLTFSLWYQGQRYSLADDNLSTRDSIAKTNSLNILYP